MTHAHLAKRPRVTRFASFELWPVVPNDGEKDPSLLRVVYCIKLICMLQMN